MQTQTAVDAEVPIFSSMKYKMMMTLKREGQSDLEGLSRKLRISKMAAYKHVKELERRGLVEHDVQRRGVGRPRLIFRPSPMSAGVYPKAYGKIALSSLAFVEKQLGRGTALDFLRNMAEGRIDEYTRKIGDGDLRARVKKFSQIRDAEGYMTGVEEKKDGIELAEHNCPALAVASQYPEACEAERGILERILGAKVEKISTLADGGAACRFRVTPR